VQCWVDDGIASGESLQVRFFGQYSIYLFFVDLQAFVSTFIFTLTTIRPIKKNLSIKKIYIYIYELSSLLHCYMPHKIYFNLNLSTGLLR
jgi:hypothetical protein